MTANRFTAWWRGIGSWKPPMQPGQKSQRLVAVVVALLLAGILLVSIFLVQSIPPSAGARSRAPLVSFSSSCLALLERWAPPQASLRSAALPSRRHDDTWAVGRQYIRRRL